MVLEHHVHRVRQGFRRTIVEIRRGDGHIAQTGHLEHVFVGFVFGDVVTAQIGLGRVAPVLEVVAHHAKHLEHVATDVDALVAGHTAIVLEELVALKFVGAQGGFVAAQVFVKARIGGGQRALEYGDGILNVFGLHAIGIAVFELRRERLVLHQLRPHFRPIGAHFHGVVHGSGGLFFEGVRTAIPKLPEIKPGIEDGGRVDASLGTTDAGRKLLAIGTAGTQRMATGTGHGIVFRQPLVIEEFFPQCHFPGVQFGVGRNRFDGFVTLSDGATIHPQTQRQKP